MACLVKPGGRDRLTMSYARYLMSIRLRRRLGPSEHVDHIDNDKLGDRFDNLQILTPAQNLAKSAKGRTYVEFVCPVCSKVFLLEKRQTHKTATPCCSRACGYVKVSRERSRAVRQRPHKPLVVGSNPTAPTSAVLRARRVRSVVGN